MAFKTVQGFTPTQTSDNANGVPNWGSADAGFDTLSGDTLQDSFLDTLQGPRLQLLPGVLSGGVCTVAGLVATVPAGTIFVAGGMPWTNLTGESASFPDDATSYLWGKANGELEVTASLTPPTGFENGKACLLCGGTAVSGTLTLDLSLQQRARTADHTNRIIGENAAVFAPVLDTIPAGFSGVIPAGSQYRLFGKLTLSGKIVLGGKLRVEG